jgi:hypothetical protein
VVLELHVCDGAEGWPEGRLGDCADEELGVLFGGVGCEVVRYGAGAGGGALDDDVFWVAAELGLLVCLNIVEGERSRYLFDILLYPVEELSLVEQACVEISILPHMFTGEEAESAYTVVEVDEDEAVAGLLDDFGAVVVGV